MSSNWVAYAKVLERMPAHVRVDTNAAKAKEQPKYGWALVVTLPLRKPGVEGLAMPEEAGQLAAIEKAVSACATEDFEASFVGSLIHAGRLHLHLYAASVEEVLRAVDLVLADFPDHPHELRCWHDPKWGTYFTRLYPSSSDWLYISAKSEAPRPLFGRDAVTVQQT